MKKIKLFSALVMGVFALNSLDSAFGMIQFDSNRQMPYEFRRDVTIAEFNDCVVDYERLKGVDSDPVFRNVLLTAGNILKDRTFGTSVQRVLNAGLDTLQLWLKLYEAQKRREEAGAAYFDAVEKFKNSTRRQERRNYATALKEWSDTEDEAIEFRNMCLADFEASKKVFLNALEALERLKNQQADCDNNIEDFFTQSCTFGHALNWENNE